MGNAEPSRNYGRLVTTQPVSRKHLGKDLVLLNHPLKTKYHAYTYMLTAVLRSTL